MRAVSLFLLSFYQVFLSIFFGGVCRFQPSCSEYARQAFLSHNFLSAFGLTFRRLLRCRPGGPYGLDPVPCGCGEQHE